VGRRRPFRRFRQRLEAAALRALGGVARLLPFELAGDLGARIGALAYRVLGRRRRIAVENLTVSLGPMPGGVGAETVARRAFEQLGRSFLEFLAIPAQRREDLLARIEFVGFEPLQDWARAGRGAVLITGHFGNWELLGMFGAMGAPMKYLLPRQTNPESDEYLNEVRRRAGVEPIVIGYGMRAGLRALREGAFLGMLPDQDARRAGIHVPFFGRPASTHTGPARLAVAAEAPIAVGVLERVGRGRFRARVLRILIPDRSAPKEAEVRRLTEEMTRALEEAIRARPDHWYWIHRRWKTPSSGASPAPVGAGLRT
jgi:Kdo2-lipid IVA lauroyltransferase/acyltransferase